MKPGGEGQAFKKKTPPRAHEEPAAREDVVVRANRCPFCHVNIQVENEPWVACARCVARHHAPCWDEAGRCGSCQGTERLAPVREGAKLRDVAEAVGPDRSTRLLGLVAVYLALTLAAVLTLILAGLNPLSLGIMGGLASALPIMIYAYVRARRRRELQIQTANRSKLVRAGWESFSARYASEKRFRSWWKFFPWEQTGILTCGDEIVFTIADPRGRKKELRFSPQEATVEWIGQDFWPNGVVSWFAIEQDGERHYFTSETGGLVFGSKATTREIYDHLVRSRPK